MRGAKKELGKNKEELKVISELFVEQTPDGGLAKKLREVQRGIQPALGFKIKVVNCCGRILGANSPLILYRMETSVNSRILCLAGKKQKD